ncbi:hypothetical protein BN1708_020225, partial [Verticillium longisporum]
RDCRFQGSDQRGNRPSAAHGRRWRRPHRC